MLCGIETGLLSLLPSAQHVIGVKSLEVQVTLTIIGAVLIVAAIAFGHYLRHVRRQMERDQERAAAELQDKIRRWAR